MPLYVCILFAVITIVCGLAALDFIDMFSKFDKENGDKCDSKK